MEYSYPIDPDWTTEEIVHVIDFYQKIEEVYEKGAKREEILSTYERFKKVVPAKSEEKTLFKDFEKKSGYVPYFAVRKARETDEGTIKLEN